MNHFLIIFLALSMLFSSTNVDGELLVELDKDIISPLYDPVDIGLKLNYVPQDNFVYTQIVDPMGNSILERYFPVDQNGHFDIILAGDPASGIPTLSEGTYVIKITGINNNKTITDKNIFVLHMKQKPLEQVEKNNEQNNIFLISIMAVIFFIIVAVLILKLKKYIMNRTNSKNQS